MDLQNLEKLPLFSAHFPIFSFNKESIDILSILKNKINACLSTI